MSSANGSTIQEKNLHDSIDQSPLSDSQKEAVHSGPREPPKFTFASLVRSPEINPLNLKSYTIPIFHFTDRYSIAFHLAWLGFFVAFFSWFAFPPLIPEAIKTDLNLTPIDVANSNIVALCATLLTRFLVGPAVDRYGPRLTLAGILLIGIIPSGLAGTAHDAGSLMAIRFFVGILGGSFVPAVAWSSAFFDKSVVGAANALVGGWGNTGGGVTFIVQSAVYSHLEGDGLTSHVAWRVAFVVVPVPLLLFVSALIIVLGSDHPAGKWSQRHSTAATAVAVAQGHITHLDHDEQRAQELKTHDKENATVTVQAANDEKAQVDAAGVTSTVDVAVNESLTLPMFVKIITNPVTWLPAILYNCSFGLELAVDANLNSTLFALYNTRAKNSSFTQLKAGYYTSIFGLLNVVTRPLGGIGADLLYRRTGNVAVKKWLSVALVFAMGLFSVGLGVYIDKRTESPSDAPVLGTIIGLEILTAFASEIANGCIFSYVPHINPWSNGTQTGIVGGMGNLGGIWFALVFRYTSSAAQLGKPYWVMGTVCAATAVVAALIPGPKNVRFYYVFTSSAS